MTLKNEASDDDVKRIRFIIDGDNLLFRDDCVAIQIAESFSKQVVSLD